jgi:DNA-binding NarL/FixJ family response regulator
MTTILDLRQHLLDSAEELDLPLTERHLTALATRLAAKAATPADRPRPISPRRMEVLLALAVGETLEETAARLCRSVDTIKTHRRLLYAELGVRSGAHAVAVGMSRGLFEAKVAEDAAWAVSLAALAAGGGA